MQRSNLSYSSSSSSGGSRGSRTVIQNQEVPLVQGFSQEQRKPSSRKPPGTSLWRKNSRGNGREEQCDNCLPLSSGMFVCNCDPSTNRGPTRGNFGTLDIHLRQSGTSRVGNGSMTMGPKPVLGTNQDDILPKEAWTDLSGTGELWPDDVSSPTFELPAKLPLRNGAQTSQNGNLSENEEGSPLLQRTKKCELRPRPLAPEEMSSPNNGIYVNLANKSTSSGPKPTPKPRVSLTSPRKVYKSQLQIDLKVNGQTQSKDDNVMNFEDTNGKNGIFTNDKTSD